MTVTEFSVNYPQYSFDFARPISLQTRIYEQSVLDTLPKELTSSHEYRGGGRGRPNLNQTLAHSQCKECRRVLRNDFFYTPPSMLRRNGIYTYCLLCAQEKNATRYDLHTLTIQNRRHIIWNYLAPRCLLCGFDRHPSAMDMHHLGAKESEIASLIIEVTLVPDSYKADRLLREASTCIALCSNCHRLLHAGVIQLPKPIKPLQYHLVELLDLLKSTTEDEQHDSTG
jgi:hypothetical protein